MFLHKTPDDGNETKLRVVLILVSIHLTLQSFPISSAIPSQSLRDIGIQLGVILVLNLCLLSSLFLAADSQVLDLNESGVRATLGNETKMCALLDDATLAHDHDVIGLPDRCQLMSNDDGGPALRSSIQRLLHDAFSMRIERTSRLVQQQNLRFRGDGSGDGDALLLATGKEAAPLSNIRIVPVWKLGDEVVGEGELGCRLDLGKLLLLRCVFPSATD